MNLYKILYSIIFLILGFFAGVRRFGFDVPDYVFMFNRVQLAGTFLNKLALAKDPMVAIIIEIVNPVLTNELVYVFLFFSMLTALFNIVLISRIKKLFKLHIYVFFYIILFYPGLDFTAIRAGLGFTLLALFFISYFSQSFFKSVFFGFSAIFSHFSVLVPILLVFKSSSKILTYTRYLLIPIIIALGSQLSLVLSFFKQTNHYEVGHGSVFAYILPTSTLLITLIYDRYILLDKQGMSRSLSFITLIISCICIGFSQVNVTVSLRLVQLSLFLLLLSFSFSENTADLNISTGIFVGLLFAFPLLIFNYGGGVYNLWEPIVSNFYHWFDVIFNGVPLKDLEMAIR